MPPVVTVVLYLSDKPWDGFRTYWEMLRPLSKEEKQVVNDYKMNIIEPYNLKAKDFTKFRTIVGECFKNFKKLGNSAAAWFEMDKENAKMDAQNVELINECMGVDMKSLTKLTKLTEEEKKEMLQSMTAGDMFRMLFRLATESKTAQKKGMQKGMKAGRQQGMQQGGLIRIKQYVDNRKSKGVDDAELKNDLMTIFALPEAEAIELLV